MRARTSGGLATAVLLAASAFTAPPSQAPPPPTASHVRLRHPGRRPRRDRARQEGPHRARPPSRGGRGARGGPAEGDRLLPVRGPHAGGGALGPGCPRERPRSRTRGDPEPDARDPALRRARRRGTPVRAPSRPRARPDREPSRSRVLGVRGRQPASAAPAVHDRPCGRRHRGRARLQHDRPEGPRAGSGRHGAGGRHGEPGQRQGAGRRGCGVRGRRGRGRRRLRPGGSRRRLRQRRAARRRDGRERRAQPARQQLALRPVRAGAPGAAARRAQGDRLLLRGPAGPQPAAAALPLGGQRGQPGEPQHLLRRHAGAAHHLRLRPHEDRPQRSRARTCAGRSSRAAAAP